LRTAVAERTQRAQYTWVTAALCCLSCLPLQTKPIDSNQYGQDYTRYEVQATVADTWLDVSWVIESHHEGHVELFLCNPGASSRFGNVTEVRPQKDNVQVSC
jgi:hypothetical protein